MKSPHFTAKIAAEEGARICDKPTKKPSKTNHPAISVFLFGRLGLAEYRNHRIRAQKTQSNV